MYEGKEHRNICVHCLIHLNILFCLFTNFQCKSWGLWYMRPLVLNPVLLLAEIRHQLNQWLVKPSKHEPSVCWVGLLLGGNVFFIYFLTDKATTSVLLPRWTRQDQSPVTFWTWRIPFSGEFSSWVKLFISYLLTFYLTRQILLISWNSFARGTWSKKLAFLEGMFFSRHLACAEYVLGITLSYYHTRFYLTVCKIDL